MKKLEDGNLYFVAPMFSGKTKISKILAPRMGREIFEMDTEIEKLAGMSIPQIFEKHKEPHFRDIETQVLRTASERQNLIISTGGGVVIRSENITIMQRSGVVGWIDVDLTILQARRQKKAEAENRPLAANLEALYWERRPLYEKAADFHTHVDIDVSAEVVAQLILIKLKPF